MFKAMRSKGFIYNAKRIILVAFLGALVGYLFTVAVKESLRQGLALDNIVVLIVFAVVILVLITLGWDIIAGKAD